MRTIAADFDDAVLGRSLPAGVEAALREAGAHRDDAPRAMAALERAKAIAPDNPAVLIALYRHHFYGHRLHAARDIARRALATGAAALGLPALWREWPRVPLVGARHEPSPRFALFALKGYAYLSLRLGDDAEARDALALLRAMDPDDCVGGALLEAVRRRASAGMLEADDDAAAAPAEWPLGRGAWARLSDI